MERNEFLSVLRGLLHELPAEEIESAVRYYEEYLDEAEDEKKALQQLGSPKDIAERILADVEKPAAPAAAEEVKKPAKKRDPWKVTGMVVLLVCASPLLISLGAVVLSVAVSLAAVLLSVIVAVIVPFLALSIALVALFFVLMGWAGSLIGVFTPGGMLLCGLALLCGALGIACGIFTGYLFRWTGLLLKELFAALRFKKKGAKTA